jgi:hypothetical protein
VNKKHKILEKGAAMLESTLCLLTFLLMTLVMVDVAQFLFIQQALTERVRDSLVRGSRVTYDEALIRRLVLYGTATPAAGQAPIFSLTSQMITVTHQINNTSEDRIRVRITGHPIRLLTPGLSHIRQSLPISMATAYDGE